MQVFVADLRVFTEKTAALRQALQLLEQEQVPLGQVQEVFYQTKKAYKRTEYLLEYLDPELAKSVNGAPIPKVVVENSDYLSLNHFEPNFMTYPAEGLQVLEELLFAEELEEDAAAEALVLAYKLEEKVALFTNGQHARTLNHKQVLESLREEMVRMMTMGITGFDTPAAGRQMEQAATALEPVLATAKLYQAMESVPRGNAASERAVQLVQRAINYLSKNQDFDSFDRLYFIRELADPAYAALSELQQQFLKPSMAQANAVTKPVNDFANSLFGEQFLQPAFYAKQDRGQQPEELVELGKTLFFDPIMSSNNQRSCASCHAPAKAFTDGQAKSLAFEQQGTVKRNAPSLLNAIYSSAYFWDGRAQYLQDQVPDVLATPEEMHTSYNEVVQKLQSSPEYRKLFKQAFNEAAEDELSANTINRALSAYMQTLVSLRSPFDAYMRRETEQLDAGVKRGFNLFMGKAGCGTCHFAPVFNGTVPPRYLESEFEVIGVPASATLDTATLDEDLGKAGVIKADAFKHSFKTPTVRNVALTAPYMHNGVFSTLHEVVELYDVGGGLGLGFNLPNQTLPAAPLELTAQEKKDLVAFMESLTDDVSGFTVPASLPYFPKKTALNNRKVGGSY